MRITLRAALLSCVGLCFVPAAYAADLIVQEPIMTSPVPTAYNWDGFYVGIQAGYGWGEADHQPAIPTGPGGNGNDLGLSGWLAGVNAGYNMHLSDQFIGGIEADINWADISGSDDTLFGEPSHTIDWMGSVRARLGFDGGVFMPYMTGGLAFGHGARESTSGGDADATHIGWTAGVGVEVAATDNLSIDLQYRYTDLGAQTYVWSGAGTDPKVSLTAHTVIAGLKWHF
jgi:outer membrane immunogenic protein